MSIEMSIQQYMAYIDDQLMPAGEARVDANTATAHYFDGHTPLKAVALIRAHRETQRKHEYAAQVICRLAEELAVVRDDLVSSFCSIPEPGGRYDLATADQKELRQITPIDEALTMAKPWLDWDPLEMPVRRLHQDDKTDAPIEAHETAPA